MSRTDKDLPSWVTAPMWQAHHYRCEHARYVATTKVCDLPAEPVVSQYRRDGGRLLRRCHWRPIAPWRPDGPPPWYVRHVWTAPQRRRVQAECRRAIAEYRATGDVDTIPSTAQHRHSASWDWY